MAASSSPAAASARAEAGEETVIRAEDLAPSAFAAGDAASAAELAALGVKRADDLEYDEANLTALDSHPVDAAKLASAKKEKYLAVVAREGVQLLMRRVFALPYEATEDGPMAVLPRPRTHIPRRLPVPETRPETKWERFAKEKGIKKTKRSRMVLDEQTGEWAPRWGYKRANDDTKDWAIPVKGGDDGMSDPFKERELKKQERVLKNKVQNLKNRERAERNKGAARRALGAAASSAESMAAAAAAGTPVGIPRTMKASEGDVSGVTGQGRQKRPRPAGETKHDKTKKVRAAQVATASMGRFDRRLPGEPEAPRDPVRHKKRAATPSGPGEHSRDLAVLSSVVHGAGAGGAKMPGAGKRSAKSTGPGAAGARVFRKDKPRK